MSIQSEVPVDSDAYAHAADRGFRATVDCLRALDMPILDLGPPNALARLLEQRFDVRLENTGTHDLTSSGCRASPAFSTQKAASSPESRMAAVSSSPNLVQT